jgi:hypothetical protein
MKLYFRDKLFQVDNINKRPNNEDLERQSKRRRCLFKIAGVIYVLYSNKLDEFVGICQ